MIPESVITMPGITDHDPGIGDHVKSESVITIVRNTHHVQEEAIGKLEDGGLVDCCHLLALQSPRGIEGITHDPVRGALGDDAKTLDDARYDNVFEPTVESFRILAYDDQIHAFVARLVAGQALGWSEVREQIQPASHLDVYRTVTGANWSCNRTLERKPRVHHCIESGLRQRSSKTIDQIPTGLEFLPINGNPSRVDDPPGCRCDFRPNSVSWNQDHSVRQPSYSSSELIHDASVSNQGLPSMYRCGTRMQPSMMRRAVRCVVTLSATHSPWRWATLAPISIMPAG